VHQRPRDAQPARQLRHRLRVAGRSAGYRERAMQQLHVRPPEAGWQVELEGTVTSEFPTQDLAWSAAKALARQFGVEALLYGRDGRVREVWGPGSKRRARRPD
jgi:hypothetical protein